MEIADDFISDFAYGKVKEVHVVAVNRPIDTSFSLPEKIFKKMFEKRYFIEIISTKNNIPNREMKEMRLAISKQALRRSRS